MIQAIESIRPELQLLFAPYGKSLEQRHVHLVVARAIDVFLPTAEKRGGRRFVRNRRLELDRNSIWIHRSNGMRGIRNHLPGERVAERTWIEVIQLGFDRCRA